jgi:hypothetical protein
MPQIRTDGDGEKSVLWGGEQASAEAMRAFLFPLLFRRCGYPPMLAGIPARRQVLAACYPLAFSVTLLLLHSKVLCRGTLRMREAD